MTRRATTVLVVAAFAAGLLPAPSLATTTPRWTDRAAAALRGAAVASDGSVYVVGEKRPRSKDKAVLIKYGPDGTRLWSRSWTPGERALTRGVAVDVGADGTVAWVGRLQKDSCEGGGWFLEIRRPGGALVRRYLSPGWRCRVAQAANDVAVGANQIVVTVHDYGCCDDPTEDGWVRAFTRAGTPTWTTNFEPPSDVPADHFDRATGVAIGNGGAVYAVGWAATQDVSSAATNRWHGTLVLQKMGPGGNVIWRKRVFTGRYSWETPARIATRGSMVMVLGATRPGGVWWGTSSPGEPWLARLTTAGAVVWSRTWAHEWRFAAIGADLAIDRRLHTWVAGTRRDPGDRGYDVFVRRYGPSGALAWSRQIDERPFLWGTGVAASSGSGAAVTGYETATRTGASSGGHTWMFR
jgi:hypothetical protein